MLTFLRRERRERLAALAAETIDLAKVSVSATVRETTVKSILSERGRGSLPTPLFKKLSVLASQ